MIKNKHKIEFRYKIPLIKMENNADYWDEDTEITDGCARQFLERMVRVYELINISSNDINNN